MIERAIVEQIIDKYHFRVRIPKYHKAESSPTAAETDGLSIATLCVPPGHSYTLGTGDVVLVGFNEGYIQDPVILGVLFRENMNSLSVSNSLIQSIDIKASAKLPSQTTIGNVTSEDIQNIAGSSSNLQTQIDLLNEKIDTLTMKLNTLFKENE